MLACLLQRFIEGEIKGGIEVTGRRGRRHRKLLDYLNPLNPELNPICYLLAVFSNECNTQHIQCADSGLLFTIDTKIIRKR